MSSDARDHHPLFSLGAAARVHKWVSPSTHPADTHLFSLGRGDLWPRRATLAASYARGGGTTASHSRESLEDNN